MADEAEPLVVQLLSADFAACDRELWRQTGPFLVTSASCGVAVYGEESHGLAEHTSQMPTGIQKAALAWQLTTKR